MEGALKIKELTYKHTQGLEASSLNNTFYSYGKRNPGTPVILVVLDDEYKAYMFKLIEWLKEKLKLNLLILTDVQDVAEA